MRAKYGADPRQSVAGAEALARLRVQAARERASEVPIALFSLVTFLGSVAAGMNSVVPGTDDITSCMIKALPVTVLVVLYELCLQKLRGQCRLASVVASTAVERHPNTKQCLSS